jgi:hypothetical protein
MPPRCALGRALCSCRSCDPLNDAAAARAAAIDADRALDERNEAKREAYKRKLRARARRAW